jgi:hypothetical protein
MKRVVTDVFPASRTKGSHTPTLSEDAASEATGIVGLSGVKMVSAPGLTVFKVAVGSAAPTTTLLSVITSPGKRLAPVPKVI